MNIPDPPLASITGRFTEISSGEASEHESSLVEFVSRDLLFVHLAVSRLAPVTGMYTNFKGSHRTGDCPAMQTSDAKKFDVVLEPGDALIWQGGLKYQWNARGGGINSVLLHKRS